MTSIAIVGGGAAGLGAAFAAVQGGLQVSLFETEPKLGGHCFGVPVPLPGGELAWVDAGVSDFNRNTFVTLNAVIEELGLAYYPVCQDASFMTLDGRAVWYSRDGQSTFLVPPPDPQALREEIVRFNGGCLEVLEDPSFSDWTARRYLDARGYSAAFRRLFFAPRAQGCFPMPDADPERYMIRSIVAFWRMHGIVGSGGANRNVVKGGMHAYTHALTGWLQARGAQLHLGTAVVGIARRADGIRLRATDPERRHLSMRFDQVVIATNANHVIGLLEDASQEERRIYAGFGWQRSRLVVHQDPALMPAERDSWGAYNYLVADPGESLLRPTITFFPNMLARLPASVPDVFVTMNPFREPAASHVITNRFFIHPSVGGITDMASERLDRLQGRAGTWFCGGYVREPFVHEQALACGVELGQRLVEALRERPGAAAPTAHAETFEEFAARIPLFAGLDTLALREVHLTAERFVAPAGQVLFRQGDAADGLYLLHDGEVSISRRLPGDEAVPLAQLGAGKLIGEMGLLDQAGRSATATVSADCSGYFMSRERFNTLRATRSQAAFAILNRFLDELCERTAALLQEIVAVIAAAPALAPAAPSAAVAPAPFGAGTSPVVPGGPTVAPATSASTSAQDGAPKATGADTAPLLPPYAILAQLPLFSTFTPDLLQQFTAPLTLRAVPRGTVLFRAGEPVQGCFVVVRGALLLSVPHGAAGRQLQIDVLGPGQCAGQIALIRHGAHLLQCEAREPSLVLHMSRECFVDLRRSGGPVASRFFDALTAGTVRLLRKANGHVTRLQPDRQATLSADLLDGATTVAAGGV